MKKIIMVFALFFTYVVDATITLRDVNEAIIQIDINGYKINFCKTGMNISNKGSHVKIESFSAQRIEINQELHNGIMHTIFYIGNKKYPIQNPCLLSTDHKILRIFEYHEEARKYQFKSQKTQSKKRSIDSSQNETQAKRSATCGSTKSNGSFDIQQQPTIQQNTRAHIPTLPHFPIQQQNHFNNPNILASRTARQLQWHSEAVEPQDRPFHHYNPEMPKQHRTKQQTNPLEFISCTQAVALYQESGTPLHFQTYYPGTYPSEESQTTYPITQNQPLPKNVLSSPQSNLPIQSRNTPPLAQTISSALPSTQIKSTTNSSRISPPAQPSLAQPKPIANSSTLPLVQLNLAQPKAITKLSTLPLAQPNSTTFEQCDESARNDIGNTDIKTTSAKDLIIELFNKITLEFLLENEEYIQLLNMTSNGSSGKIMIKLKKALEKEIILEKKREIIKKIKELITETLKEKDFYISEDDWSYSLEKDAQDIKIKKELMLETLKEQDSDEAIEEWLNQILDPAECMELSSS
ncbi:MAG: hypothetical protein Q8L85_01225 [Alphaproteobacteria bacterium]|nr:hypothetical protein [Alphaproteobacteria bacterium]